MTVTVAGGQGFYGDHVLPRIVNAACGMKASDPLRERVCEGLEGEVVEIGFGSGLNIPFYPDSIFVSVDWPVPIELVLVHEILHYNKTGDVFGLPLEEGLADIGARYLVVKYDLLTAYSLRRVDTYPVERKGIDFVLDEITRRTGKSHDESVDMFLGALLTGNQDRMQEIFGAATWKRSRIAP